MFTFSYWLVHNTPVDGVVKSSFFLMWICICCLHTRLRNTTIFFLLWHFWNSLTHGDTAHLSDIGKKYTYMYACIIASLILPPNLNNNWMTAVIGRSRHVTGRTTLRLVWGRIQDLDRHACYELVIYTLMFVLFYNYDVLSLLCVFYIELELSLPGGFKSITVVKASSIFM